MKFLNFWLIILIDGSIADWYRGQRQCASPDHVVTLGPADAKFTAAWLTSLTDHDCETINIKAAEELLIANWALTMLNQQGIRLAIKIYDTCSKDTGYVQGALMFAKNAHKADFACSEVAHASTPLLLGVTVSGLMNKSEDFVALLRSNPLPIVAFEEENVLQLNISGARVLSTVPSLFNYLELAIELIKNGSNNLVTILFDDNLVSNAIITTIVARIEDSKLKVFDSIPFSKLNNFHSEKSLTSRDSNIILTILKNEQSAELAKKVGNLPNKQIIQLLSGQSPQFSTVNNTNQVIALHPKPIPKLFEEFRHFLVDYVNKNYKVASPIRKYIEKRFNCEFGSENPDLACEQLTLQHLEQNLWSKSVKLDHVLYMVYLYGSLAKVHSLKKHPNMLQFKFGKDDPKVLRDKVLEVGKLDNTVSYEKLQASQISYDTNGHIETELLAEYSSFRQDTPETRSHLLKFHSPKSASIKSTCSYTLAQCVRCENRVHLSKEDGVYLQTAGDLYLLGLFDIGQMDKKTKKCLKTSKDNVKTLIYPLGFSFTLETLRKKYADLKLLENVHLSSIIIDTCSSERRTVELVTKLLNADCLSIETVSATVNITIPTYNVVGVAVGQKEQLHQITRLLFGSDHMGPEIETPSPNLLLVGPAAEPTPLWSSFDELNTMPDHMIQAKLLVQLLSKNTWDYVTAIVSEYDMFNSRSYNVFKNLAETSSLCIGEEIKLRHRANLDIVEVRKPSTKVLVMFTTAQDTATYLRSLVDKFGDTKFTFVLMNDAHNFQLSIDNDTARSILEQHTLGSVSVQPSNRLESDFIDFVARANPGLLNKEWFLESWESVFQCRWPSNSHLSSIHKNNCTTTEKLADTKVLKNLGQQLLTREAYFIHGVETLVFALDAIYKRLCQEQKGLCEEFFEQYRVALNDLAKNTPKSEKFVVYTMKPTAGNAGQFQEVGTWSLKDGFNFVEAILNYDPGSTVGSTDLPVSSCKLPACRCHLPHDFFSKAIVDDQDSVRDVEISPIELERSEDFIGWPTALTEKIAEYTFEDFIAVGKDWKSQVWTYFALVVASILLIGTLAVLGLVVTKLLFGVIRGNQSLGVCLLAGVAALFATSYFFVLDPCPTICRLRYFGHSISYCLCFGVMIAKACQLRNAETLGSNGFISFWNYWLLLFFIIVVQLALNLQWVLGRSPMTKTLVRDPENPDISGYSYKCSWNGDEFVVSQVYVIILLGMASFLAFVSRNVKRNYKETRWLLYTCVLCLPVWILWTTLYLVLPPVYQDRIVTFELIICGTVILCLMFGPKVYILLSYEPILIEYPPTSVLKKYKGARSFDLTSAFKLPNSPPHGVMDSSAYFETEDIYSNLTKPLPVFKPNVMFGSLKSSGSKSPDSSSVNSASSDTAIYQTAIRKKKINRKAKKEKSVAVEIEPQAQTEPEN